MEKNKKNLLSVILLHWVDVIMSLCLLRLVATCWSTPLPTWEPKITFYSPASKKRHIVPWPAQTSNVSQLPISHHGDVFFVVFFLHVVLEVPLFIKGDMPFSDGKTKTHKILVCFHKSSQIIKGKYVSEEVWMPALGRGPVAFVHFVSFFILLSLTHSYMCQAKKELGKRVLPLGNGKQSIQILTTCH